MTDIRALAERAVARWEDVEPDLRNMFPMEGEAALLARAVLRLLEAGEALSVQAGLVARDGESPDVLIYHIHQWSAAVNGEDGG